jgi:transcriptional regulator with XRE-family HTH domain
VPSVGEFLRRKRAQLVPERAHVAARKRRTPGLRREEVAELAGVSVDWYTRLEQDRASAASTSVLEAISRALCLNPDERRYLFRLARGVEPLPTSARQTLHPALAAALTVIQDLPAISFGPRLDILATNALGDALFLGFQPEGPFPMNGAWFVFCDERAHALYPEYPRVARETVGALRAALAQHPHDPAFVELIEALSRRSELFAQFWSEQNVNEKTGTQKLFAHPIAGLLDFALHALTPSDARDQQLIFYVPRDETTQRGVRVLQAQCERRAGSRSLSQS